MSQRKYFLGKITDKKSHLFYYITLVSLWDGTEQLYKCYFVRKLERCFKEQNRFDKSAPFRDKDM